MLTKDIRIVSDTVEFIFTSVNSVISTEKVWKPHRHWRELWGSLGLLGPISATWFCFHHAGESSGTKHGRGRTEQSERTP